MRSARKGYSKEPRSKSQLFTSDWSLFDAFWGWRFGWGGMLDKCGWVGDTAVTSTGGAVMHYGTRENAARFEVQSLSYKRDIVWYTLF